MKIGKCKNKKLIKAALNFKPYDYAFLLEIEKEALIKMANYFETSNIAVGDEIVYRDLKLAIKLLDIILENDSAYNYSDKSMRKYVNIKNVKRFFSVSGDFESAIMKDVLRCEKAWYLYSKLREYKTRTWWN